MTEVIVYRNPLEAQLYSSGMLFPIIVGCVVMFVVTLALLQLPNFVSSLQPRRRYKMWSNVAVAVGTLCGGVVALMMIN